jgi:hypothetical protein
MLKVDQATLEKLESQYPGIIEQICYFDGLDLPHWPDCGSSDTADVQCGIIGRTINIAVATKKFKLIANGPKPGSYFCNACMKYFEQVHVGQRA